MEPLQLLKSRRTALALGDPGPSSLEVCGLLECAASAPDHGGLRPWRFIIIFSDARKAFGALLAADYLRRNPDADTQQRQREYEKAFRAPTIIVVAAVFDESSRIPSSEQHSATAAAAQNILLAAHALGFGSMWKTGPAAYSETVKQGLGLPPTAQIIGFIFLGTDTRPALKPPRERVYLDRVRWWPGRDANLERHSKDSALLARDLDYLGETK